MIDLFQAIKDTPIPTLLVVGGLLFLILAVAGKIAGRIEVPPAQQKWAGVIGIVLLVVGIALHLTPVSLPPSTLAAGVVPASPTAVASDSAPPVSVSPMPPLATSVSLLPTSTPALPTASLSPTNTPPSPTSSTPLRSPEASVRAYWQAVSAGQYESAWGMLSANFRWTTHHNDFTNYKQGYLDMALCDVAPDAMDTITSDQDYALLYATIVYHKDSTCTVSTLDLAFHLAPDHMRGLWLIDRVDLR